MPNIYTLTQMCIYNMKIHIYVSISVNVNNRLYIYIYIYIYTYRGILYNCNSLYS